MASAEKMFPNINRSLYTYYSGQAVNSRTRISWIQYQFMEKYNRELRKNSSQF